MNTKHIIIEILPRASWVIEWTCLYLSQYFTNNHFHLNYPISIIMVGLITLILGLFFIVWTFVYLLKPMFTKELVIRGPYTYVRHPLYTAIYTALTGAGILFFNAWWFIVLIVFMPLWYFIGKAEELQMTELYPHEYPNYRKNTGMFFPKLWYNRSGK